MSEKVLITGGTGLIGKALTSQLLDRGYKIIILTRKIPSDPQPRIQYEIWNVAKGEISSTALRAADYIVHLAGSGVMDKKWTDDYKKEIAESRTQSSALLIKGLKENEHKVRMLISSSAIGWYGEDPAPSPRDGFLESDPPADDFLGHTCKNWELSIDPVLKMNIRLVKLRTGIVLSNDGGAYPEFKRSLKFGVASILGSGKQMISWIHINDLCRMIIYSIENDQVNGTYNAVAPAPVDNKKLILKTAKHLRGSFFVPVHIPEFVLKIILGSRSIEILKSTTANCNKILLTGFTFLIPTIDMAIADLGK